MKANILRCFNNKAETYDSAAFLQANVGRQLEKRLPDRAQNILEIGCGTGLFSELLLSKYPNAKFLLTDIAPNMVTQCQNRLGHYQNIQFDCLDGEVLPIDGTYDLIISNMSMHWFTNHSNSFENIIMRLEQGGHFIFSMLGINSLKEWHAIYKSYNYPIATPIFPSKDTIAKLFPCMTLVTDCVSYHYKNAYDFLTSLKKIGATAVPENNTPLSIGKLRKILREFSNDFEMSYEIIYGDFIQC